MLREISRRPPYAALEAAGARLEAALRAEIEERRLADRVALVRLGSLLTLFLGPGPMRDFASVKRSDTKRYARFFHAMRERGVWLPPAQFEAWFLSTAHTDGDLRRTARAAGESLAEAFES